MTYNEFKEIISAKFPEITPEQMEQFRKMEELYRDWNAKINVVSRKDIDQLYRHHVLHSLGIAAYVKIHMPDVYDHLRGEGPYSAALPLKILDLGTGGGFPGVPLAVMFPKAEFTLCDSISKKIKVVTEGANAIELKNVTPMWSRSENLKGDYDFVVSRGVTTLRNFVPIVKHLYTKGIIYLKGGDIYSEALECSNGCGIPKEKFHNTEISKWFEEDFFIEKHIVTILK